MSASRPAVLEGTTARPSPSQSPSQKSVKRASFGSFGERVLDDPHLPAARAQHEAPVREERHAADLDARSFSGGTR